MLEQIDAMKKKMANTIATKRQNTSSLTTNPLK
jgi:hypothetical protein